MINITTKITNSREVLYNIHIEHFEPLSFINMAKYPHLMAILAKYDASLPTIFIQNGKEIPHSSVKTGPLTVIFEGIPYEVKCA
jgi:hypothetical protein